MPDDSWTAHLSHRCQAGTALLCRSPFSADLVWTASQLSIIVASVPA
ncbi:hypothetical protein ACOI1H_24225 [Loktanella sp. DJP18]